MTGDVESEIAFGLEIQNLPVPAIRARLDQAAALLRPDGFFQVIEHHPGPFAVVVLGVVPEAGQPVFAPMIAGRQMKSHGPSYGCDAGWVSLLPATRQSMFLPIRSSSTNNRRSRG